MDSGCNMGQKVAVTTADFEYEPYLLRSSNSTYLKAVLYNCINVYSLICNLLCLHNSLRCTAVGTEETPTADFAWQSALRSIIQRLLHGNAEDEYRICCTYYSLK